jgi:hypothetical protein
MWPPHQTCVTPRFTPELRRSIGRRETRIAGTPSPITTPIRHRHAVTKAIATRYRRGDKAGKGRILEGLCATTGWHRNHARKAFGQALKPRIVRPRKPRPPLFGAEVVGALRFCWEVPGSTTDRTSRAPNGDVARPSSLMVGHGSGSIGFGRSTQVAAVPQIGSRSLYRLATAELTCGTATCSVLRR